MAFLTERDRLYITPEDICCHVGDDYAAQMGAITPPIYQSSLFVLPTPDNGVVTDYAYSRTSNPTVEVAERKIAALEGADGALCFASGLSAMTSAVLHFVHAGSHVVLVSTSYGGVRAFVTRYLAEKFNVTYTLVTGGFDEIEAAIRPETSLIYLESPSSLVFRMQDLDAVTALARSRGIGTVIDNTYATPLHQQPLKHGVDISCHTVSKYMGGHSDLVGGALAARREIIESIMHREREIMGGIMDPHAAFLLTRGLRTMPLRLRQHAVHAAKVAAFLEHHPKVERVFYPGSETYEQKELFRRYLTGSNGLMSFVPKGSPETITRMIGSRHFFQLGCSWGGFESLILPLSVGYSPEQAAEQDIPANLVRIHVGLESPDALIADLDAGLAML